ncbi:MAG: tyrosinase [Arenicella sp.]|jgi:tyrosinase
MNKITKYLKPLLYFAFLVGCKFAQAQTLAYFLPHDYDGTTAITRVDNQADFTLLCAGSDPLAGLDLVRGFSGASTCSGANVSQRWQTPLEVLLLVDDTQALSPYLIRMLTAQGALQAIQGRQIVVPRRIELNNSSNSMILMVVGEEAYRTGQSAAGWFAALDGISASSAAVAGGVLKRLNWERFKTTPQLQEFVSAVATLKSNTTASDPNSWLFWSNIHVQYCPHRKPYFLAWHRGYIHLFEKKIQELSSNPSFRLPYWDYYSSPTMPVEFTNSSGNNPLYVARTNTNVSAALSYSPFANSVVNFQTGEANAFEPSVESMPHNQVHNIIGRPFMRGKTSPQDPIFWVHHANIDRLWAAWTASGNGRMQPPASDSYWTQNLTRSRTVNGAKFNYGSGLDMDRHLTSETRSTLFYEYDDLTLPLNSASQPAAPTRPSNRASPPSGASVSPPSGSSSAMAAAVLGDDSVTLALPVETALASTLNAAKQSGRDLNSLNFAIELSGIELTSAAQAGGFGYSVYLNLPTQGGGDDANHFVGTVGPFEIASLEHEHGGDHHAGDGVLSLVIPARVLDSAVIDASEIELSFIRINGENHPSGELIIIRRIEITQGRGRPRLNNV